MGARGRGIRLVREQEELGSAFERAARESPSKKVFLERAVVEGFRHVEVQIVGDSTGEIVHLWERECSIQRRYQKIVEFAPSAIRGFDDGNRLADEIIDAAVEMARSIRFVSLGTFEFLANPISGEFFFLEINPRLQVEHTVTEQIAQVDLVYLQLDIAQGMLLPSAKQATARNILTQLVWKKSALPPPSHSIQLRLMAEDATRNFPLSVGKIKSSSFPVGNGIRVDTALKANGGSQVSPDFDSLLAKVVVTGFSWKATIKKACRALEDTKIEGFETNLDLLRGICAAGHFHGNSCDTQWLETNSTQILKEGQAMSKSLARTRSGHSETYTSNPSMSGMSSSTVLLRRGDAWRINLSSGEDRHSVQESILLQLTRVLRNEFPSLLNAEIECVIPGTDRPKSFQLSAKAVSASSSRNTSSTSRHGDPSNPEHIVIPFSGSLVEVLVEKGDVVMPEQVICVVKQMKMELEVRARDQTKGVVKWVTGVGGTYGANTTASWFELLPGCARIGPATQLGQIL